MTGTIHNTMKQTQTLTEKQAAKLAALELENSLETAFAELTGFTPSIVSASSGEPFATFHPKNAEDFFSILNQLQPTGEKFTLTFAGKADVQTFSPYSIHYGGKHSNPNYMDIDVKFKHSLCPVWVDMPQDVKEKKFSISTIQGQHKGFGRYETLYTWASKGGTTVQTYYGGHKTMYAANEAEATELKQFIFS